MTDDLVDEKIRTELEKIANKIVEDYETAVKESFKSGEWFEKNCNYKSKNEIYRKYGDAFKRVDELSDDELWELIDMFLNFKENCHWTGLFHQKKKIKESISDMREAIKLTIEFFQNSKEITIKNVLEGFSNIKGVGPAIATPIMHVMYPEKFSVLNSKLYKALEKIGVTKDMEITNDWTHDYPITNELSHILLEKIRKKYDVEDAYSLWEVDIIWHYIAVGSTELPKNPTKEVHSMSLSYKLQVILYGPPGTGKTYNAIKFAKEKGATRDNGRLEIVTFHPSFSYEDFVEGIRPRTEGKDVIFEVRDGVFKRMCREAYDALVKHLNEKGIPINNWKSMDAEKKKEIRSRINEEIKKNKSLRFYLIIDEINRGDISKIFGELITLLETDKRLFGENEMRVTLPYSQEEFGVPPNLYIIGTMNTADRSIALMDVALRRRFAFVEMMPNIELLKNRLGNDGLIGTAITALEKVNEIIRKNYDRDHQIGHSYYLQLKGIEGDENIKDILKRIWLYEILPLLQEYFYGRDNDLKEVLFKCSENGNRWESMGGENVDLIQCYRNEIEKDGIVKFLKKVIGQKNESQ